MTARYFIVLRERGTDTHHLYEDTPPTKSQLAGRPVLFRLELKGRWREMPLAALVEEYQRRKAAGMLPGEKAKAASL
jgi:hypothetical protein